jgi:hypothetical protein
LPKTGGKMVFSVAMDKGSGLELMIV